MNFSFFISKRIIFNTQPSFSKFIIRLAVAATTLSVAAMVVTLSMVNGFQTAVSQKVFSFWGQIRVQNLEVLRPSGIEETVFTGSDSLEKVIAQTPGVAHFQTYAVKSVVLKTKEQFEGVILKGVDHRFQSHPFGQFIKDGQTIDFTDSAYSKDVLLSRHTAKRLSVTIGDTIQCFFIRGANDIRTRSLIVGGLYQTGIEEYDHGFALADIRFLRRLNLWDSLQVGGYEAWVDKGFNVDSVAANVDYQLPLGMKCYTIRQLFPHIFDWLSIQDQTKKIVVGIMILVAAINLITCLLILVMERTRMVGVLKAVGMAESHIRRIFWYYAGWIALVGIGLGLILGIGLCVIQQATGFIKMDEATYYVSTVPIQMVWWQIGLVAAGSFAICFVALRLPLFLVNAITPIKAIRFK